MLWIEANIQVRSLNSNKVASFFSSFYLFLYEGKRIVLLFQYDAGTDNRKERVLSSSFRKHDDLWQTNGKKFKLFVLMCIHQFLSESRETGNFFTRLLPGCMTSLQQRLFVSFWIFHQSTRTWKERDLRKNFVLWCYIVKELIKSIPVEWCSVFILVTITLRAARGCSWRETTEVRVATEQKTMETESD